MDRENKCSHRRYMERYTTVTAMYFPPIYENGININPDKNITTHVCECLECGRVFSYRTCQGEIINESANYN